MLSAHNKTVAKGETWGSGMQHRQESAARQGMGLFLWPCVLLSQQDSRGILTSSALRIKLRVLMTVACTHTFKNA